MKSLNVLPKIHLHPILIIFIIISFITGTFIDLFIILSIVFIHELGHFFMARHFKWRIRGMMLWVFGGVLDTDEHGNRSIKEEALVTVAGPFQHVIIHLFLFFLAFISPIPENIINIAIHYNSIILLFNLIPIWPLDGGKLLMLILSKYLPYKKAYQITIISSIIVSFIFLILQLGLFSFTLSTVMIMLFLIMENWKDWKQRYYVFIRFLLNRYEGSSHVSKVEPIKVTSNLKLMDVFSQFRREIKHSIYINFANHDRIVVDETDCLYSYFNDKQHNSQIGEVFNTS
ncbi:site-2 protease family protein [Oceanobacillus sp. Castelsardo]|uniref:site-2 protease family protein n=1 Tax=Oceanobacillus sp. Castelsardo TaxID=1851204 RepID=UPI000837F69A|nr:site-2 protease family protein [Oceanobacillus sp. Castelsardo]